MKVWCRPPVSLFVAALLLLPLTKVSAQQSDAHGNSAQAKEFQAALARCSKQVPPSGVRATVRLEKGKPTKIYDCDKSTAVGKEAKCILFESPDGSISESCSENSTASSGRACTLTIGQDVNVRCIPTTASNAITIGSAARPQNAVYLDDSSGVDTRVTNALADQVLQKGVLQGDGSVSMPASEVMRAQYPGLLDSVDPRSQDAARYLGVETDDQRASRALLRIAKDSTFSGPSQIFQPDDFEPPNPGLSVRNENHFQRVVDEQTATLLPEMSALLPQAPLHPASPFGISAASQLSSTFQAPDSQNGTGITGDRESSNVVDLRTGITPGLNEWTHVIRTYEANMGNWWQGLFGLGRRS